MENHPLPPLKKLQKENDTFQMLERLSNESFYYGNFFFNYPFYMLQYCNLTVI